jgi:hypothetical protein
VRSRAGILSLALIAFGISAYGQNPSMTTTDQPTSQSAAQKHGRSAGGDIGSGSGDIGKGAGKGAGNLAKGTGKGAADLATLHPVDAAGQLGKVEHLQAKTSLSIQQKGRGKSSKVRVSCSKSPSSPSAKGDTPSISDLSFAFRSCSGDRLQFGDRCQRRMAHRTEATRGLRRRR